MRDTTFFPMVKKKLFLKVLSWACLFAISIPFAEIFLSNNYKTSVFYFLSLSFLLIFWEKKEFRKIFSNPTIFQYSLLFFLFSFHIFTYFFLNTFFERPSELPSSETISFLKLDSAFLLKKPFEILWQQVLIIWLLIILKRHDVRLKTILFTFVLVFGFFHILLIQTIGIQFSLYFTAFAVLASFVFPFLIEKKKNGFLYSSFLHLIDSSIKTNDF